MPDVVRSLCYYCGCGCALEYLVEGGRAVGVRACKDPVSQGRPCIKGLTAHEPLGVNRITTPLVRRAKAEKLVQVSWAEAYGAIRARLAGLGPDEVLFLGSGEFSNEDNYVLGKLARIGLHTQSVDCCARLCHAATVAALHATMGTTAAPAGMDDVLAADVILAVGTNPASNYPVFFNRIVTARGYGAKLITVQFEPHETTRYADLSLNIYPESIVAFLGGLIRVMMELAPAAARGLPGWDEVARAVVNLTPERVAQVCGIRLTDYYAVIEAVAGAKRLALLHGMGLTQHANGTQNALAACDLALLKGAALIPMRGKVNVQGAADTGACPGWIPCGGSAEATAELWGVPPPTGPGLNLPQAVFAQPVKAVYIMGMNPAVSLPDLTRVHAWLKDAFVVLQHHHHCLTADFADVVLPAAMLVEEVGTVTTGERRVRAVRPVVPPPAGKPNWRILCELAHELGVGGAFAYPDAATIFAEITKAVPAYAGLTWERVTASDEVFADRSPAFTRLVPFSTVVSPATSSEFPFILTTRRLPQHFCTGETSRAADSLAKLAPKPYVLVDDEDAARLGLNDGDLVLLRTVVGEIILPCRIYAEFRPGVVVVPFHYEEALINRLVPALGQLDAVTQTPNYKAIPCSVEKAFQI